jgi:serine/threonine protein kinase
MSINSPKICPQCGGPLREDAAGGLCPRCVMALNLKAETVVTGEPAAASAPRTPEELAPHFPQLEILECLGRGGMGVVYKARQPQLDRVVALKILAPERVTEARFADRFLREARALAKLNHPNIVAVHDFGQTGGYFYLVMEYVDGVNLRELLRGGRLPPAEALAIVPAICDALQYAHDRGIVHRDIKPENILIDKEGKVKIADFGIAKMIQAEADGAELPAGPEIGAAPTHDPTGVVGTPKYMAPEQAEKPGAVDHRADIYSLGVVFYEMLTGELPGKLLEAPSKKVQIDVRLDEVVLRALERKPELRYQQAGEIKTRVATIVGGVPPSGVPADPAPVKYSWIMSPVSSPEVREIAAHLTRAERSDIVFLGFLWGLLVAVATFGNLWLLWSFPPPGNWIVASIVVALFFACLPAMCRTQRRLLASSAWARERGYHVGNIKLFSFSRRNLRPVLIFLGAVIVLIFGQLRLFTHLSGSSELGANLKEHSAREKENSARLAAQAGRNHGTTGAPFVGVFSNGTVELLLVAADPASNTVCWLADGSPSSAPYPYTGGRVWAVDKEVRAVAFRVHGPSSPPVLKFNKEIGTPSSVSGGFTDPKPLDAIFTESFTCPSNLPKMDVQIGLANGPWETLIGLGPKGGAEENADPDGNMWDLAVQTTGSGDEVAVACQYSIKQDWETRLVAGETNGEVKTLWPKSSIGANLTSVMTSMSRDEFEKVKGFQFQRRKRQWVEFRNVSLEPGHHTKVEVLDATR